MVRSILISLLLFFVFACDKDHHGELRIVSGMVLVPENLEHFTFCVGVVITSGPDGGPSICNLSDTVRCFYTEIVPQNEYSYFLVEDLPPYFSLEVLNLGQSLRPFSISIPSQVFSPFEGDNRISIVAWCDSIENSIFDWPSESGRFPYKRLADGDSVTAIEMIMFENKTDYFIIGKDSIIDLEKSSYRNFYFHF